MLLTPRGLQTARRSEGRYGTPSLSRSRALRCAGPPEHSSTRARVRQVCASAPVPRMLSVVINGDGCGG